MNNAGLTGRQCRGMILFCRQRPLQGIKQLFLLLCGFRSLLVCVFHGEFGSAVHFWIQGHLRRHTLVVRIRAMHDMQIYDVVIHFIQERFEESFMNFKPPMAAAAPTCLPFFFAEPAFSPTAAPPCSSKRLIRPVRQLSIAIERKQVFAV